MKKVKLGEVCEILSGYAFKSSQFNDNKIGLPLIRIRDVERGFSDTYFEGTYPEEYLIKNGDLLITMDGSFILKKWEGDLALLNQRVCKIKITDKSVDEGYISWLIPKFLKEIEDKTPFVTVKHLSVAKIKDISFVLPNKLEQKLIAKKLNTISQIYDFRKIQSEKFNELVKSRFNEMFGDPLNNNKKFAVKTGQQCFKFSSGKFLDKHDRVFEGYPAYGGNGIAWKSRKYLIDNPTIIIGRVGAYCGNVRTTHGKVWISDNAIYIKEFKNSDFNLVFLLELMKVIDFSKFADFSGQPKITQKPLENQKYILPPLALQNEFADFVVQIDKSQFACEIAIKVWRNSLKFSII
ncbi:TPA: restriction endonuclease subunit S [Streptococcus pneumoniae]|uniref:restriction endonuclease subunit S n=2 Tax=Streptococcus pneumoniae TaxID=1313 RepID=UPI0005DE6081|nr:restriction endonuclease subunit S [Streptococcus pneumoniae]CTH05609.1 translocating restriction locus specificity subunit [Streptococcus pneumoniae]CYP81463.1 restriction modification system DNA specificity subunit [Streptococcus pneumoniae]VMG98041.1 restriction modification system DNA specificity subunit [Streptococcus pneumoniae]VOQ85697.1 restriction modification system DNA specificity subunit [Streptococcus pneumoniae]VQR76630.1 restriction modification system DNA specificity subunit